jgi:NSS family neurotransmitter:Na+ symporter
MAAAGGAHSHWTSRFAFLMASVGFAVGLGNIWRFPYVAGENGGAAFVLIYLICAFLIGVPILMAELMIGRRGNAAPPIAMAGWPPESGRSRSGSGSAAWGCWPPSPSNRLLRGRRLGALVPVQGPDHRFRRRGCGDRRRRSSRAVLGDNFGMLFWTLVGPGDHRPDHLRRGQGRHRARGHHHDAPDVALLVVLATFNVFAGGFGEALAWLFTPDFSKVTFATVLAAVGQAFFSIGVGMGGMMTYGSYLPRDFSITQSVLFIVIADTAVALLAGLVIFPAVFTYGLDPGAGAGLIFQTLPVAFAQMPGGYLFSVLFFLMLSVAGITSMVGLSSRSTPGRGAVRRVAARERPARGRLDRRAQYPQHPVLQRPR